MKVASSTSKAVLTDLFVGCRHFNRFIGRANSLKRLSKACLILGETVKSADLAFSALQGYKDTYGNTMEHREVITCDIKHGLQYLGNTVYLLAERDASVRVNKQNCQGINLVLCGRG